MVWGDLRDGAGAGGISWKVIIDGQGGATGNDATELPDKLDQVPGA